MNGMDFIEEVGKEPAAARKGRKRDRFVSAADQLQDETVAGASEEDSTRRGLAPGWKRHTVVVHDDWLALVSRMTEELSITNADAWRYLLRLGVRDYTAGERPDLERRPRALNKLTGLE